MIATNFNPRTPRGVRLHGLSDFCMSVKISIHAPREGCDRAMAALPETVADFNPRTPRGVRRFYSALLVRYWEISIHAPREGCDVLNIQVSDLHINFNPRTPRGVRHYSLFSSRPNDLFQSTHPARGATHPHPHHWRWPGHFNPRTPRGVRQQTLPKSREFAWLNLLICTRGRRLSIQKQTRLCSIKLSFMLFGCEPAGEGVSSWTSHATKSKVRLEGRSAYSQSARSSAHSDFPGNKSGDCPVRGP